MEKQECQVCGHINKGFNEYHRDFVTIKGKTYCEVCIKAFDAELKRTIPVTTTQNFEGYRITRYIGIECAGSIHEEGFVRCKEKAMNKLRAIAYTQDANAIIGVTATPILGEGVMVTGTLVQMEPVPVV
jgi:uncharacterized protein YbjQ (UPF0145 family)